MILVSRGLGSQAVIIGAVKLGLSQAEQMGMACLNLNTGDGSPDSGVPGGQGSRPRGRRSKMSENSEKWS